MRQSKWDGENKGRHLYNIQKQLEMREDFLGIERKTA